MTHLTRRAFGAGVLAAVAGPAVATTATADQPISVPEPLVEMDGRPHENPKNYPGWRSVVTGVARPPAGHRIEAVEVRFRSTAVLHNGPWTGATVQLDTTKLPHTWTAELARLEVGEYWVDVKVMMLAPDGQRLAYDCLDRPTARGHPPAG